jgi:hypothetical protein
MLCRRWGLSSEEEEIEDRNAEDEDDEIEWRAGKQRRGDCVTKEDDDGEGVLMTVVGAIIGFCGDTVEEDDDAEEEEEEEQVGEGDGGRQEEVVVVDVM